MTKMSRYALITALAMFLAGCVGQREPAPVEEVKPAPEQPAEPQQYFAHHSLPSRKNQASICWPQIDNKVRVFHAGCGVNTLSRLLDRASFQA